MVHLGKVYSIPLKAIMSYIARTLSEYIDHSQSTQYKISYYLLSHPHTHTIYNKLLLINPSSVHTHTLHNKLLLINPAPSPHMHYIICCNLYDN